MLSILLDLCKLRLWLEYHFLLPRSSVIIPALVILECPLAVKEITYLSIWYASNERKSLTLLTNLGSISFVCYQFDLVFAGFFAHNVRNFCRLSCWSFFCGLWNMSLHHSKSACTISILHLLWNSVSIVMVFWVWVICV